jgi:hypothetical protein
MNTALVLYFNEWLLALTERNVIPRIWRPVVDAFQILPEDMDKLPDASFSLIDKGLAAQEGDTLVLDPLLALLAGEARAAVSAREISPGIFIIQCPRLCLLFAPYTRAAGMWRIAPFKNEDELRAAYEEECLNG